MASIEKRIGDSSNISFRVKVRLKGFPVQTATFERRTDAVKWASATETAIRENRYFKTSASKKHTLGDVIDRYIKDILVRKPKSMYAQKRQLIWWKNHLGKYLLADITSSLIAECRDKLVNTTNNRGVKNTPSTANRYVAALSHALTIAVKEWGWLEDSPIRKLSKLKEPRGRVRFLSDEERERLLAVCKESSSRTLYLVVVLALSTGARKMEIIGLKWEDIDFERQVIVVHETKNGERRVLPLLGHALELTQNYAKTANSNKGYVFPSKEGLSPIDIRAPWETAIKKASIQDFRFHDLRHSAASYLAMSGASLAELSAVLGHKTLSMVQRYSHLSESHTAGVVAKMNNKIFG
jgi:integrase